MYEPFRINYRPHSTVSAPCPSISPPTVPRHVQIFLISPPYSPHQPALYYRSRPARRDATTAHERAPPVLYLKQNASLSFPLRTKNEPPSHNREGGSFLRYTFGSGHRHSCQADDDSNITPFPPPGQETATLRDRGHTGPQSPVDRSGLQPGRDCKACAADPSFRFRRVFSFRR